ncbi:2OG-Fe(II) oxygenase [Duganella sp. LX47W]|uniref:2OG-Fe(II) oxygenase n=1 Tax=Rugamonas apoptosis TaxID=2758570 RepID=A0A7W2FAP2_9BURK|nr:2OG-Fe(II) oxygenase [Rugamonas apoptosis]
MKNGELDFGAGAPPRQPRKTAPGLAVPPAGASGTADGARVGAGAGAGAGGIVGVDAAADAGAAEQAARQAAARRAIGAAVGIATHVAGLDWQAIAEELDMNGYAVVPGMLTADECAAMAVQYDHGDLFRSRIVMAQHGFGSGEYQYFRYPLPSTVAALRQALYGPLAAIANRWHELLAMDARFPADHAEFLARCHAAGQQRPTPLLLRYRPGDYNCLHQDLYGEHVFPLQAAVLLSQPGVDFEGGEFVLTEQRPRQQSRVEVVPLARGDMVIFPVFQRPAQGVRGVYRAGMRHGVSRLRSGSRHTLGLIFHDAT